MLAFKLTILASSLALGAASVGSCYDSTTHVVTCDTDNSTCVTAGNYWYAPGYMSSYSGCCHCDSGCDHSAETSTDCSYYDTPSSDGSCYDSTTHVVTCAAPRPRKNAKGGGRRSRARPVARAPSRASAATPASSQATSPRRTATATGTRPATCRPTRAAATATSPATTRRRRAPTARRPTTTRTPSTAPATT